MPVAGRAKDELEATVFELSLAYFSPLQGRHFIVQREQGAPVDTRLLEVRRLPDLPQQQRQAFSLLFKGPVSPQLPQHLYRMRCTGMAETLDIFLVPVGADAAGTLYEAVFG